MQLKFLTLNLFEGGLFFDNIIDFLREELPDILALQEVYNGKVGTISKNLKSVEILGQELKNFYHYFSPELIDCRSEGKFEYGNAVFSKFPILNSQTFFLHSAVQEIRNSNRSGGFEKHPKNMQHLEIDFNTKSLNVFNLHGIWGQDGYDNQRRSKMARVIVKSVKDKKNVILAGDFNLFPETKVVQDIEVLLKNVFKGELKSTFNMKHKTSQSFATSVVDMIFVSRNVRVLDHYCPKVDISDHMPLVSVFDY